MTVSDEYLKEQREKFWLMLQENKELDKKIVRFSMHATKDGQDYPHIDVGVSRPLNKKEAKILEDYSVQSP